MKIQIQSIHFDADQKLLDYIQRKCDKLDHFFDKIDSAQVYLKLVKKGDPSQKAVEIKLLVPGETLIASHESLTFEESVDLTTESLKRQLNRYKEKMRA